MGDIRGQKFVVDTVGGYGCVNRLVRREGIANADFKELFNCFKTFARKDIILEDGRKGISGEKNLGFHSFRLVR